MEWRPFPFRVASQTNGKSDFGRSHWALVWLGPVQAEESSRDAHQAA